MTIRLAAAQEAAQHRAPGYLPALLAAATREGDILHLTPEAYKHLRQTYAPPTGPGTLLSKTLARFGIRPGPSCECDHHAAEMNRKGPTWCLTHLPEITAWLKQAAMLQNLPCPTLAAHILVLCTTLAATLQSKFSPPPK